MNPNGATSLLTINQQPQKWPNLLTFATSKIKLKWHYKQVL